MLLNLKKKTNKKRECSSSDQKKDQNYIIGTQKQNIKEKNYIIIIIMESANVALAIEWDLIKMMI